MVSSGFKSSCKAVTRLALALSTKARTIKRLLWPLTFYFIPVFYKTHDWTSLPLFRSKNYSSESILCPGVLSFHELLPSEPPANQKQPWQMVAASEGCWTGTGRFCPDSHTHLSDFLQALQNNRERHSQNRSLDLSSRMFARIYAQTIGLSFFLFQLVEKRLQKMGKKSSCF